MRALSRAMRQVTEGDFSVRVKPFHSENKFDYMDIMFEDFNRMAQELGQHRDDEERLYRQRVPRDPNAADRCQQLRLALARGGLSEAEQREYAATIAAASESLSTMVSNILRLNKLENQEITPNAVPYDLTRQLCDCALAHEARWEAKHIDFDAQLEERVMVLADETMMEIVFNNLISNAIKFTEPGGRIVLRQMKDGDDVVVTVADTGCGMDEATLAHIFDKFYQGDTSHSRDGNGLGLALVRRVLEISDGAISVTSAPGEGSEFMVRLPRMAETA